MSTGDALTITGLSAGYGAAPVVIDLSLHVAPGEVVAIMGANGAGKSTLLNSICGIHRNFTGSVCYGERELAPLTPAGIAELGVALVPEGRRLFSSQTVDQNLLLGGWVRRRPARLLYSRRDAIYDRFPHLGERRRQAAGTLSGGEAQLLAIGMALMAEPELLLLDEPSLGLSPVVADAVFDEIGRINQDGTTVVLVEQDASRALASATRGYVMYLGRIVKSGTAEELTNSADLIDAYLGVGGG